MANFNVDELFDSMPNDAYRILASWLVQHDRSDLLDLNMGHYFDHDESALDNRAALIATLAPSFAYRYATQYPILNNLTRATSNKIDKQNRMQFVQLVEDGRWDERIKVFLLRHNRLMTAANEHRKANASLEGQLRAMNDPEPIRSIDSFTASDTPGAAKEAVRSARDIALSIVRLGVPILQEYASRHDYRFELRSPLAFQGPGLKQLQSSRVAIQNPERYMGAGQNVAVDIAQQLDIMFGLTRESFYMWMGIAGTVVMHEPRRSVVVTPYDMPSALIADSNRTLPVITSHQDSPFFGDSIVRIDHVHGDVIASFKAGSANMIGVTDILSPPMSEEIPNLMALVGFAFTVLVANIAVGKGNHKPRWTHAMLNPRNISTMKDLAAYIIDSARNEVQ